MSITPLNIGSAPNDASGQSLRSGGQVINANFAELDTRTAAAQSKADAAIPASQKAVASGVAPLDGGGKVPAAHLPSYVDDVLEYFTLAAMPKPGEAGKIYIALNTNRQYRWPDGGNDYVELVASPGTTDAIVEGAVNKWWTNSRTITSVLTGLSVVAGGVISATDTIIAALGKLQNQITARALKGANNDITSITGLTTALSIAQGGTGSNTEGGARTALGLGTAATKNIGTSGDALGLMNTENTYTSKQTYSGASATSIAAYCAEFQGSGGTADGGRMLFSQNSTYGVAMSAVATGGTNGYMSFQWVTRATGVQSSQPMRLSFDGSALFGGNILPFADNLYSCGTSARRFTTVYAMTGTINTSDGREKTPVRALEDAELAAASEMAKEVGAYKWLAAISQKGEDARSHIGLTVQKAIEIMERHGLDPFAYGFICFDEWTDGYVDHPPTYGEVEVEDGDPSEVMLSEGWREKIQDAGSRYGFRTDELSLFMLAGLERRMLKMEERAQA